MRQRISAGWQKHKRKVFWTSIATSVTIIASICLIVFLYVNLLLGEEARVYLSPEFVATNTTQGGVVPIHLELTLANRIFCSTRCEYDLSDVSHGVVQDRGTFDVSNYGTRSYDRNITISDFGAGQKLFVYRIACKTITTNLCPTQNESVVRKALLQIDYTPTPAQLAARSDALDVVDKTTGLLQAASSNISYDRLLVGNLTPVQFDPLLPALAQLGARLTTGVDRLNTLLKDWTGGDYVKVRSALEESGTLAQSANLSQDAAMLDAKMRADVVAHNALIGNLLAVSGRIPDFERLISHASSALLAGDPSDAANRVGKAVARLNATLFALNTKRFSDYGSLLDQVQTANITFDALADGSIRGIGDQVALVQQALVREDLAICRADAALQAGTFNVSATGCLNSTAGSHLDAMIAQQGGWQAIGLPASLDVLEAACAQAHASWEAARNASAQMIITFNASTIPDDTTVFLRSFAAACDIQNNVSFALLPLSVGSVTLPPASAVPSGKQDIGITLPDDPPTCCTLGRCAPCCDTPACREASWRPLILLHGHSFSLSTSVYHSIEIFNPFEEKLVADGDYVWVGTLIPNPNSTFPPGSLGRGPVPIVVKPTYYIETYNDKYGLKQSEGKTGNVDTYAIRLKTTIDEIRADTGKQKVDIVAHSMGGLVVRRYMQVFGTDAIGKVVLIATPNGGIEDNVYRLCKLIGSVTECDDMHKGSLLLGKLNDPTNQPALPGSAWSLVVGSGCDTEQKADGDGVVTVKNSLLPDMEGVATLQVNGTCTTTDKLHNDLLDPALHPEVYSFVLQRLGGR